MKTLKESLFSRKNLKTQHPFGLTKEDLIGDLEGFPMGVVVRMLEEQEKQRNKPDVKVFQKSYNATWNSGGFDWGESEDKFDFWQKVIRFKDFNIFFKRYPEYARYNLT